MCSLEKMVVLFCLTEFFLFLETAYVEEICTLVYNRISVKNNELVYLKAK